MTIVDPLISFARRVECEEDGLYFNRLFFKYRFGQKMIMGPHHPVVQAALDRTMLPPGDPDFISRLIINLPPGYTKTEMCTIGYMARGLAINPMARFLHLSYSEKLVLINSANTRAIVKSKLFQQMWPIDTKDDMDSKHIWHTAENGGVTATPTGGQVTGFRAGHMDQTKFTGALIVDDGVKPNDANSDTMRTKVNVGFNETIASRLAIETVPIIIIMQRLDWDDLSGFLLRGGSGEMWHHLNLPMIINHDDKYPSEYTHGVPIEHDLPEGWLWPFKHNEKHEQSLRAHRRRWLAQCLQAPPKHDGNVSLWSEALIATARSNKFDIVPPIRTVVAVDPAVSTNDDSDETGIIVASEYPDKKYSLDADYTMKASPLTWANATMQAAEDHDADAVVVEVNQGGDLCESNLRAAGYTGRIIKVHATKGKTKRAEPVVAVYEMGRVQHKGGMIDLEDEQINYDRITGKSNGKSPNRLDAAVWGLTELIKPVTMGDMLDLAIGE